MALLSFENVGIKALAGCVPKNMINNLEYTDVFSAEEAKEYGLIDEIFVREKKSKGLVPPKP